MGEALVWYAAYGSNIDRPRFLTYLTGGPVPGTEHRQLGARDPAGPRAEQPHRFDRSIRFALHSDRWNGAIAFLDHETTSSGALGRRYLITAAQLADVVAQENRRPTVPLPLDDLTPGQIHVLSAHNYDGLLLLDRVEDVPVVTFTSPRDPSELAPGTPSAAYLGTVARGIRDAHDITNSDICGLLSKAPGVAGTWSVTEIEALLI